MPHASCFMPHAWYSMLDAGSSIHDSTCLCMEGSTISLPHGRARIASAWMTKTKDKYVSKLVKTVDDHCEMRLKDEASRGSCTA